MRKEISELWGKWYRHKKNLIVIYTICLVYLWILNEHIKMFNIRHHCLSWNENGSLFCIDFVIYYYITLYDLIVTNLGSLIVSMRSEWSHTSASTIFMRMTNVLKNVVIPHFKFPLYIKQMLIYGLTSDGLALRQFKYDHMMYVICITTNMHITHIILSHINLRMGLVYSYTKTMQSIYACCHISYLQLNL